MLLKDLFIGTDVKLSADEKKVKIRGIAYNSQNIKNNYIFIAIKGFKSDGHNYIENAIEKGATVVVVENHWLKNNKSKIEEYKEREIVILSSKNNRVLLSKISANFYKNPSKKLKVIGVTGTNGKTTITYLIESILTNKGEKVGVLGTINYRIGKKVFPAVTTTPESLEINKYLSLMLENKVKYVIMEVSSHSLELHRVDDIEFDYAIFTNLTEDHFDFHKNYENYFKAKEKLFSLLAKSSKKKKCAIINIDDKYGKKLASRYKKRVEVITYSLHNNGDLNAYDIELSFKGSKFKVKYKNSSYEFSINLLGRYNIYNSLAAIAVGIKEKFSIKKIQEGLLKLKSVPGRLEIIEKDGIYIGIDYAHTDDALKNVLNTIEELNPEKIITVFGAGGDRDKSKRSRMGRIVALLSDELIITSDNPRSENPKDIIKDIEKGVIEVRKKGYYKIVDRKKAIKKSIKMAERGTFILIAGKGHEDYQIIGNRIIHFNDKEIVKKYLGVV